MNAPHLPSVQELAWATRLKQAAMATPTPENGNENDLQVEDVSDWEFLQHAIVAKNDTAAALQRLRNLQAIKQRYGIIRDGSVDEAARDLRTFLQTHPGLYLSLATSKGSSSRTQIFCSEYQHFQAARMKSEEAYAVYMRAAFYVLQASQYNLPALRAGMVLLLDVHGALRYRSFTTEARARDLYGKAYPIRIQGVVLLRASVALRLAYRWIFKPWMSPKVRALLDIPPGGASNRNEYLQNKHTKDALPESWGGDLSVDDFHETILDRLRQRYHMVETFRL